MEDFKTLLQRSETFEEYMKLVEAETGMDADEAQDYFINEQDRLANEEDRFTLKV